MTPEEQEKEDTLTSTYRLEERRSGEGAKRQGETRRPYDRDYSRILHSPSFRRLQSKTQVLGVGHSDFYRTRLTHSLEAAQIARGITHHLRHANSGIAFALPPRSLIEASALAHDLGHPPFGHYGEKQLHLLMREHGGFEGNGQTLRILAVLENGAQAHGLDLTRRLLLAVLKYPVNIAESMPEYLPEELPNDGPASRKGLTPPKGYLPTEEGLVRWLLEPFSEVERAWLRETQPPIKKGKTPKPIHRTLDSTIMELADDVAYGVHDLEDALRLDSVSKAQLEESPRDLRALLTRALEGREATADIVFSNLASSKARERKDAIGELVNLFVSSVVIAENTTKGEAPLECPLLTHRAELPAPQRALLDGLTDFVRDELITRPIVRQIESRGAFIISEVWGVLHGTSPDLLPGEHYGRWEVAGDDEAARSRALCDYVAGMTDSYITQLYERLFYPHHGSPFDVQ